ncbi:hypothetical protein LCGC14_0326310 [marine sediment metagenome]|uniref:Uncharacterized protein n=1 Tax=marine sediment metagenome TaxID=412755 RepID=A0A0F9THZ6_9ZZZZ
MLELRRKLREKILIGRGPDRIEIVVNQIGRSAVRLGITAPRNILIIRSELQNCFVCEWCNNPIQGRAVTHQGRHFFCSVDCRADCLAHYDANGGQDA